MDCNINFYASVYKVNIMYYIQEHVLRIAQLAKMCVYNKESNGRW